MHFLAKLKLAAAAVLACAAAAALAAYLGYRHGLDVERGRHALNMQDAIVRTFEATRADAEAESARRQAAALHDARAAAATREARLKGQIHALETDRPACRWPADRRLHLNAAVAAANARPDAAAGSLPGAVPEPAEPAR